jgi:tetraprenyl-beta-curcumene synthase
LAREIPAEEIRRDALSTLADKRGHIDGAGLFTILPRRRNRDLLRLLVAYEVIWDFLDTVNEHGAAAGQVNGRQLHVALIDALDPTRPISDYYRHHPWKDDGGYLRSLVETCRAATSELPSYARVRPMLLIEATRAQVLAINHDVDHEARDRGLRRWALEQHLPSQLEWFELSGAASASLTVHALFALATEPALSRAQIIRTHSAYFPWISAATTMLDSYVDQDEDAANDDHSYIGHYRTPQIAALRTSELTRRGLHEARALPRADRHILIIACMAAMYLSKDSAQTPSMRCTTAELIEAGGTLTRLLRPILRLWRIIYSQRAA